MPFFFQIYVKMFLIVEMESVLNLVLVVIMLLTVPTAMMMKRAVLLVSLKDQVLLVPNKYSLDHNHDHRARRF